MYEIESRNILTPQNGLNIYRGRTEDSILLTEIPGADSMDVGVKVDAPELLAGVLKTRRNKGIILMGNLGDPYNVHEEKYHLTRKSLKVIENHDYGVIIDTKQNLILRDLDVLKGIAGKTKCAVEITFPTLKDETLKKIEGEETLSVKDRFDLVKELKKEGIEVIAVINPVIPFVNDEPSDIRNIILELSACGILKIDLMDMRLAIKKSVRDFFYTEFKKRFPERYDEFSADFSETGEVLPRNQKAVLKEMTELCKSYEIMCDTRQIKAWKRQYENRTVGQQLSMFDSGLM